MLQLRNAYQEAVDRSTSGVRRLVMGAALVAAAVLMGCGGGGGGNEPAEVPGKQITIDVQPASVKVQDGESVTLQVTASGQSGLTYVWTKSGSPVGGGSEASLKFVATYADNGTKYKVAVSSQGADTVSSVEVTVTVVPRVVVINAQPVGRIEASPGQSIRIEVSASGTGPLTYKWTRSGQIVSTGADNSFVIGPVVAEDDGKQYQVEVSGPGGSVTSDATTVSVAATPRAPVVTAAPKALTNVIAGQAVTLTVVATGVDQIQWVRNEAPVAGANAQTYTTPAMAEEDDGVRYAAVLTNETGSTTSEAATIRVSAPARVTVDPVPIEAYEGEQAVFAVVAGGTGPFSYQWLEGNDALPGATEKTLALTAAAATNDKLYSVRVRNALGQATSASAKLTVKMRPAVPTITLQPVDEVARVGNRATYTASATGTEPLVFKWKRNGALIQGAQGKSYTTAALAMVDDGALISVSVSNGTDTVAESKSARINVVKAVQRVEAGYLHSIAVTDDGGVWAWGSNTSGQLGTQTVGISSSRPVEVKNADGSPFKSGGTVAAGTDHTVAVRADGTVWAWGNGLYGSLGDGSVSVHNEQVPVATKLANGQALGGVTAVVAAVRFSVALKGSDGSVWAWGYNRYGKLGDGTLANRGHAAPVQASPGVPLVGVTKVAAGGDRAMAVKGGRVWSWGDNANGGLGNGSLNWSAVPVLVETAAGVPLEGVKDVAAGIQHSVALTADGRAYAWGGNNSGALGDGTTNRRTRAVLMKDANGIALENIIAIAAGENTTVLLMADGTVWMSGDNSYGQQGAGLIGSAYTLIAKPVLVVGGAVMGGVTQISTKLDHVLVQRNGGDVWAWGYDNAEQLGNPDKSSATNPIPAKVGGV